MTRPTAAEVAARSAKNRASRYSNGLADPEKAAKRANGLAYPAKRLESGFKKPQAVYLTLPYPPSVNHYWLPNWNHSKRL